MNKKTLWILIGLIVIVLVVWLYKAKNPAVTSNSTIKIGAALALTGDASTWGEAEMNGINLAVNQINAAGGVNGKKIEIVTEDSKSTSKDSISAVQKLTSFDGLKYIIGPTWLDSYPGAQGVVKGKDILLISPSASITAVQQGGVTPNVFSVWYRVDALTDGLAKTMKDKGETKVALVFQFLYLYLL